MPFTQKTGFNFSESGIAAYAPKSSGVYGIFNGTTWIYVGETKDMETRLYAHLRGESDQSPRILRQKPTHFVFENCDEAKRKTLETALIAELDPVCNRT